MAVDKGEIAGLAALDHRQDLHRPVQEVRQGQGRFHGLPPRGGAVHRHYDRFAVLLRPLIIPPFLKIMPTSRPTPRAMSTAMMPNNSG